jgi:hypothetical protein
VHHVYYLKEAKGKAAPPSVPISAKPSVLKQGINRNDMMLFTATDRVPQYLDDAHIIILLVFRNT